MGDEKEKKVNIQEPPVEMSHAGSGLDKSVTNSSDSVLNLDRYNLRQKIYYTMSYPSFSMSSRLYSIFISLMVCLSIAQLVVQSYATLALSAKTALRTIDLVVTVIFTADYFIRLVLSDDKIAFVFGWFNIVDLLSFLPFYLELAISFATGPRSLKALRILRLLRLFRLLRMSRQMVMLQVLLAALMDAWKSIMLLYFTIFVFTIVAGSVLYYIETAFCVWVPEAQQWQYIESVTGFEPGGPNGVATKYQDITNGMYWAVVTVTTVGYGDIVPVTWAGRLAGCIVLLCAVVVLALPITLVGGTFAKHYDEMKAKGGADGLSFSAFQESKLLKFGEKGNEVASDAVTRLTWEEVLMDGETQKLLADMSRQLGAQEEIWGNQRQSLKTLCVEAEALLQNLSPDFAMDDEKEE